MNGNDWMTAAELAKYLRCSVRHIQQEASAGNLPSVKFGGKTLFNKEAVNNYLLAQSSEISIDEEKVKSTQQPTQPEEKKMPENINKRVSFDIREEADQDKIQSLIEQLVDYKDGNEHFLNALANNLRSDLNQSGFSFLSRKTAAQLSRWMHPHRWSSREKHASPIAKDISRELFGEVLDRFKA